MEEHDDVSKGFASVPRSDLKIGGNEFDKRQESSVNPIRNSGNTTGQSCKDSDKAKEMSRVSLVSESFVSSKSELLSQEVVKPCGCEKGVLVKRDDVQRCGLDLNSDAVSSCLNESVCSSRRREKSGLTDVYSECGSSHVADKENDPMKLWKAMKENGFLSNPHGGISVTSSSCLVSSSHGGIPAPRKRGRKSKNNDAAMAKKRKIEIARKEEVDRFARLAAPSGLLNELNPGIINHVRNKRQVLSIIENVVRSERDSGNFHHSAMRHSDIAVGGSRKNFRDVKTDVSRPGFNYSMRYSDGNSADGELSEENNTAGSRFQGAGKFFENVSEDSADLNCASVLTVKAATVASQWMELLHQDLKGRVSALRRSKKRVRAVVATELPFLIEREFPGDQENDPNILLNGASRDSTVDIHKARWMALFNQLEQTLSEEEKQLENWLNQVRQLQSLCDQGLQHLSMSSGQNFLQLGMPLDSRASDGLISDKDLVVRAAAASLFSTCNFLASMENITCT